MSEERTKSFAVSKRMVWESYKKVCASNGSAGIDQESIEMFNENMKGNLYKLWNRMSSGTYFPPAVRTVLIPKKQGGKRPLGIPTVTDRIAQGVVKESLERIVDPLFSENSYGYRPGRSAHQALEQCERNCKQYSWVLDVDIRNFFETLSHEWMMRMVRHHTAEKWVLLYTERWLKAGIEQEDGSIVNRTKGTPQGGVISPLLANVYLHHAVDLWMKKFYPANPFERYADDVIIHCRSKEEAEQLRSNIGQRLREFELELHPEKTKVVYCKTSDRKDDHDENSFTFLGYSFQPRERYNHKTRRKFLGFGGAISSKAKANIREKIRATFKPRNVQITLTEVAKRMNPKIRGWLQYYCKLEADPALKVFGYMNELIKKWIQKKFRTDNWTEIHRQYDQIVRDNRALFYHWQKGILT